MYFKGHMAAGAVTASTAAVIATPSQDVSVLFSNMILCAFSSLLSSQLADIDTPESSISKAFPFMRIITNAVTLLAEFVCICVLICTFQIAENRITVQDYKHLIVFIAVFGVQVWLRLNLQHRGFTHTFLFNAILSAIVFYPYFASIKNNYYFMFALGIASGLFSHLLFDTITIQGCPVFAPFSKKNTRLLKRFKLRSGKDDKYGVAFCIIIMALVITQRLIYIFSDKIAA